MRKLKDAPQLIHAHTGGQQVHHAVCQDHGRQVRVSLCVSVHDACQCVQKCHSQLLIAFQAKALFEHHHITPVAHINLSNHTPVSIHRNDKLAELQRILRSKPQGTRFMVRVQNVCVFVSCKQVECTLLHVL